MTFAVVSIAAILALHSGDNSQTAFRSGGLVLDEFGRTGILLLFAVLFPTLPLVASLLFRILRLRPDQPDAVKNDIYECGVETEGDTWVQFNFRYYLVALIFVAFDVEVIFLYAWAVSGAEIALQGFIAAMVFILILVIGYFYDWRKGGLEWR
jgi:NADH-quinone oxidoreductase subunit A